MTQDTPNYRVGDSKFYMLTRRVNLLDHLVPPLPVQIATEETVKLDLPRDELETSARILIHYTNANGNSMLFKVSDTEGLDAEYKLDEFITGYTASVDIDFDQIGKDEVTRMRFVIFSILNYAIGVSIGLERVKSPNIKTTAERVLKGIVACLYNGSDDVMVFYRDGTKREDGTNPAFITQIWSLSKQ